MASIEGLELPHSGPFSALAAVPVFLWTSDYFTALLAAIRKITVVIGISPSAASGSRIVLVPRNGGAPLGDFSLIHFMDGDSASSKGNSREMASLQLLGTTVTGTVPRPPRPGVIVLTVLFTPGLGFIFNTICGTGGVVLVLTSGRDARYG